MRDADGEDRAFAKQAFYKESTAMAADDVLYDRQPKTCAFLRAALLTIDPVKAFREARQMPSLYTLSAIAHAQQRESFSGRCGKG